MDNSISLIWILLVFFIAVVIFFFALYFSIKKNENNGIVRPINISLMRKIFSNAVRIIEKNIVSSRKKYNIPWIILLNEGNKDQRIPVELSGISENLSGSEKLKLEGNSFNWHFFDRGVLIELSSDALRAGEFDDESENRWEEFLKLCGHYRSQRPLDSILISVPAKLLLQAENNKEVKKNIYDLATLTSRRIWIAQNRFAIRFAVYFVISGCEKIDGFTSFGESLPKKMQEGLFGWSSKYDSSILFNSSWTNEAFDSIESSVSNLSAELVAGDVRSKVNLKQFFLPLKLSKLRQGTSIYLDKLMEANSFHEPFFLRGIYLTSDEKSPLFLKDILQKKVFPEFGITKAANSTKLKNPIMNGFLSWGFYLFIFIWSAGLIYTTYKGAQVLPKLVEGIEGLNQDAKQRTQANASGEILDFEWYRKTAVSLMISLAELQTVRVRTNTEDFYNPFMPGSWPIFDDLFERSVKRMDRDFAELGINTFRRALELKAANISGTEYDQVSGRMLNSGSSCSPPEKDITRLSPGLGESLDYKSLPEFLALQKFSKDAEELNQAIKAMKRLKINSRTSQEDLRFLSRYALNVELTGEIDGIVNLFQRSITRGKNIVDSEKISAALRCSLVEGVLAFNKKMFSENPLISDEEKIILAQEKLLGISLESISSDEIIKILVEMQKTIEDQELLLARGGGMWMDKYTLNLGQEFNEFLISISKNNLLGEEIAKKVKEKTEQDFASMKVEYETLVVRRGTEIGLSSSTDKSGNEIYVLSNARKNLRDAVEKLLSEPYMVPTVGKGLFFDLGTSNFVSWNKNYLNEAIQFKKYREKVIDEVLPIFPSVYRDIVRKVIDKKMVLRLEDLLANAFSTGSDFGGFKATSSNNDASTYLMNLEKLQTIIFLFKDMGKLDNADLLEEIIVYDAMNRLSLVNDSFMEKNFFSPIDEGFNKWFGGKEFLRTSFGVTDTLELIESIQFQMIEIEELATLAKAYSAGISRDVTSRERNRWDLISKEIENYKKKLPTSSLARLERFLTSLSSDFSIDNCQTILDKNIYTRNVKNYFEFQHAKIHRDLFDRCNFLKQQSMLDKWTMFIEEYKRLANFKRPFVNNKQNNIDLNEYNSIENVEVYELISILSLLPKKISVSDITEIEEDQKKIKDFYDQLIEIKKLFSPLFINGSSSNFGYEIEVNFRTNREEEIEGNKIIDWKFFVGENVQKLREENKSFLWRPGDKIKLILRFANDTSVNPMRNNNNPFFMINKKNAIFEFDGPWALFDLLQIHTISSKKKSLGEKKQLLKFDFPITLDDSNDINVDDSISNARVFISMVIKDPATKKIIKWPNVFPQMFPNIISKKNQIISKF